MIAAIVISLVRGGSLWGLASIRLRYGWVALVAFALQSIILYAPLTRSEGLFGGRTLLLLATYGVVLVLVGLNHRIPGLRWIGLGLGLNLIVMLANEGFMPVTPKALERAGLTHLALSLEQGSRILATKDILLSRGETSMWILSDIFVIPPPVGTVVSIGDLLLAVGAFRFFFQSTHRAATAYKTGTTLAETATHLPPHSGETLGSRSQHQGCESVR
jgi:hypothetical protein